MPKEQQHSAETKTESLSCHETEPGKSQNSPFSFCYNRKRKRAPHRRLFYIEKIGPPLKYINILLQLTLVKRVVSYTVVNPKKNPKFQSRRSHSFPGSMNIMFM